MILTSSRFKTSAYEKDTIKIWKGKSHGKKILRKQVSDKGLVSRIHTKHWQPIRQSSFFFNGQRFQHLTKEDLWMARKPIRRCSTSLAIREYKWKQMRCTSTLLEGWRPRLTHQCWENVEQTDVPLHLRFLNPAPFIFPRETEHTPTGTLTSGCLWHFY